MPTPRRGLWTWTKHVVNLAMATKASALSWRLDQRPRDRAFATEMIAFLDRHHGQVSGVFSGDECLSGRNPLQGTELCAVVEFMYSLEHLFSVFGDLSFADRLERVAFNALPAAISPDGWSHQYDQQANQVQCTINPEHGWSTNGPESNLFGLEPNYGCCTANMHQGWPKLVSHLWMRSADDGLVAAAWAPCQVRADVRDVPVTLTVETDYPFRDVAHDRPSSPSRPVRFPLHLRVPAWATGATVRTGERRRGADDARGAAPRRARVDGEADTDHSTSRCAPWCRRATTTPSRWNADRSSTRCASASSGRASTPTSRTASCRTATSRCDRPRPGTTASSSTTAGAEGAFRFEERPVGERPFSPEGAGVVATARGQRIPDWKMQRGWAGELSLPERAWSDPARPISTEPVEDITLLPYGCTNIRITEFPRIAPRR